MESRCDINIIQYGDGKTFSQLNKRIEQKGTKTKKEGKARSDCVDDGSCKINK